MNRKPALFTLTALFMLGAHASIHAQDPEGHGPHPFEGSFVLEVERSIDGSVLAENSLKAQAWFTKDQALVSITRKAKGDGSETLYDLKEGLRYTLVTEDGKKLAYRAQLDENHGQAPENVNAPDVNLMTEKQVIREEPCVKVESKSNEGIWLGWMATSFEAPFASLCRRIGIGEEARVAAIDGVHSFPMQYTWTTADGKDVTTCTISKVNLGEVKEVEQALIDRTIVDK